MNDSTHSQPDAPLQGSAQVQDSAAGPAATSAGDQPTRALGLDEAPTLPYPASSAATETGQVFGDYELLRKIAQGGMGDGYCSERGLQPGRPVPRSGWPGRDRENLGLHEP